MSFGIRSSVARNNRGGVAFYNGASTTSAVSELTSSYYTLPGIGAGNGGAVSYDPRLYPSLYPAHYQQQQSYSSSSSSVASAPPYAPAALNFNGNMCVGSKSCVRSQKIVTCYTPGCMDETSVSCLSEPDLPKAVLTTDPNLVIIPTNAIIDGVEFFGIDGFSTKDVFSIGFGQLNQGITFPLIEDADSDTANEKVGGCRFFNSNRPDGRNDKNIVLYPSNVNVILNQPITVGTLQVVVYYHLKVI